MPPRRNFLKPPARIIRRGSRLLRPAVDSGGGAAPAFVAQPIAQRRRTLPVARRGNFFDIQLGGGPQLVAAYQVDSGGSNTNTLLSPAFMPAPGEIIIVKAQSEFGDGGAFPTPTGGGLTYRLRRSDSSSSHDRVALWTAEVSASPGSMQVSLGSPGATANAHSMVVERWANGYLALNPVSVLTTGVASIPSTTLITTLPRSVISWLNSDWNALNGASRVYSVTPGVVYETGYIFVSTKATFYWAWQRAATQGTQTFGLTAPGGQNWTLVGIEILADPIVVPGFVAQSRGRRLALTRRGEFFFAPPIVAAPPPVVTTPPQSLTQRRQSLGQVRRGRIFGTVPPPVVVAAPTYTPPLLTRRRQPLGRIRDGQFFATGPSAQEPLPLLTRRRQALPLLRHGRLYSVVPAPVVVPSAVWSPGPIEPAQRRLSFRVRRGQFYPVVPAPVVAAPAVWVPPLIQSATQHRVLGIRRGQFFEAPLIVVAPVVTGVPGFLTRRRQPLLSQRHGRFYPSWGPPSVCPRMLARGRGRMLPSRRGRYFWHGQNFPAMPPMVHRIRRVYRPGLPQTRYRTRFFWLLLVPPSEVWATGRVVQSGVAGSGSNASDATGTVGQSGATGHGESGDSDHGTVKEEHVEGSVRLH